MKVRTDAYRKDGIRYLDKVTALFGGYKRRTIEMLEPFAGMRVLDAGCGVGDDIRALAKIAGFNGRSVGIDVSAEMIAKARERCDATEAPIEFIRGDLCRMDIADAAFDRVRADRVFQHLADPEQAMVELVRVTAPNGCLVVTDVDWSTLVVDGHPLALNQRLLRHHVSRQVNGEAGRTLFGLFKRAGLRDIEVISETFTVTDADLAFFLWGLEASACDAVDKGVATNVEVKAWIDDLMKRHRDGAFFSAITGFGVRGRRPA